MKRILLLLSSILVMFACSKEQNDTSIKAVAVTGISLNKTSLSLTEGDEYPLVPTIAPSNASDKSVTWASDNEAIVTVSSEGLVKALKAGKATVTATTVDGGKKASCSVDVAPKIIAVTGATISPETLEMEVGEQKILSASVTPENATNKNITFVSSKESVATVSQEGIVEAIAVGNAIVTATTEDGNFKAHCTVTVKDKVVHVTGITLNKTSLSLTEGEESTLVPTITPSNATDKSVTWSSDDEAIVTVSSEGLVKALKAGKATVTATTVDGGEKASCSVEVSQGMGAVTGSASHISCRNAEISGQAILPGTMTTDLSFGVLYSTSSGVLVGTATQIVAKTFDSDYNFTVNTEVLEPETTYYYRSYIIKDQDISYGELKSFKTLAVSSMIQTAAASDINPKDAVLNAGLDLTDCKYDALEYGFEVTPSGGSAYKVKSTNLSQKKYSAKAESLTKNSEYSYTAYVTLDGRTYKADAKSFTTASIQASVTAESSNVKYSTATISGKLTVASEGTFTKSAYLYHSSTASTLDALKSSGTKQTITLNSDGTYSVVAGGLKADAKNYYCVVAKVDDAEFTTSVKNFTTLAFPQPQSVNLGLSVKWASFNIGASKPEECGHYFAWGDVTGQTWDGSKWSGSGFSTYPTYEVDSNDNLKPEYDAAHVILGGKWRMPTKAEFEELVNNCTCTWTTINGVNGRLFTSKKTGYTDKSIFLPAAGDGYSSSLDNAGSSGFYWSSTFNLGYYAWYLYFGSSDVDAYGSDRFYGQSVRPVTE